MKNMLKTFLADEAGASAAEYALILGVIGTAIALSAIALGSAINASIVRATLAVEGGTTAAA